MRRRKIELPTLENVIRLFSLRLKDFSGESKRSYQKAFSSFQIFIISRYSLSQSLDSLVVENWLMENLLNKLSMKTVSFYLDKISSLYSAVAHNLIGGKTDMFKEIKIKLRHFDASHIQLIKINRIIEKISSKAIRSRNQGKRSLLIDEIIRFSKYPDSPAKPAIKYIWGAFALKAGVKGEVISAVIGPVARKLKFPDICDNVPVDFSLKIEAGKMVINSIYGEELQWFAMRLRPKVKFEDLIDRFARLDKEVGMPEIFYPSEEIAKRVGRKVVWKGKPIIRDIVFFKKRKSEIYPLFCKIFDLAWCYRTPGSVPGNYASIPAKAMEDFKKAIGILIPQFDLTPSGEMDLKPGDEIIFINSENREEHARILKKPSFDELGNKIYRVTLLNSNGRWDIGVDARLIKKA